MISEHKFNQDILNYFLSFQAEIYFKIQQPTSDIVQTQMKLWINWKQKKKKKTKKKDHLIKSWRLLLLLVKGAMFIIQRILDLQFHRHLKWALTSLGTREMNHGRRFWRTNQNDPIREKSKQIRCEFRESEESRNGYWV